MSTNSNINCNELLQSIHVHGGFLKDLCTIYRSDDVAVTLNTAQKKVTLQFPFKFDDLKVSIILNKYVTDLVLYQIVNFFMFF